MKDVGADRGSGQGIEIREEKDEGADPGSDQGIEEMKKKDEEVDRMKDPLAQGMREETGAKADRDRRTEIEVQS